MAISSNRSLITRGAVAYDELDVSGSTRLFAGGQAYYHDSGYLTSSYSTEARAAGIVLEEADNRSGAAGAIKCRVLTQGEVAVEYSGSTAVDSAYGKAAHGVDGDDAFLCMSGTAAAHNHNAAVFGVFKEPHESDTSLQWLEVRVADNDANK